MNRLPLFLLLIGVIVSLMAQQPTQTFAVPSAAISIPVMSQSDMASMPHCMPVAGQQPTQTPRKCGVAGCIAMMTSGVPLIPADQIAAMPVAASAADNEYMGIFETLHGRTTVPELEPPSILI